MKALWPTRSLIVNMQEYFSSRRIFGYMQVRRAAAGSRCCGFLIAPPRPSLSLIRREDQVAQP